MSNESSVDIFRPATESIPALKELSKFDGNGITVELDNREFTIKTVKYVTPDGRSRGIWGMWDSTGKFAAGYERGLDSEAASSSQDNHWELKSHLNEVTNQHIPQEFLELTKYMYSMYPFYVDKKYWEGKGNTTDNPRIAQLFWATILATLEDAGIEEITINRDATYANRTRKKFSPYAEDQNLFYPELSPNSSFYTRYAVDEKYRPRNDGSGDVATTLSTHCSGIQLALINNALKKYEP